MGKLMLFTDGSVHAITKIGFGAYLRVTENETFGDLTPMVKRFEGTSSTKLELQTLLWALGEIHTSEKEVQVYTDSQNILGLPGRRKRFEKNHYLSKNGSLVHNHELYKKFYEITDKVNCAFIKVEGHKKSSQKSRIDQIFTIVDKASRNALRKAHSDF